jgi:DNA invertase Pin-like site-specific DNA recombinase
MPIPAAQYLRMSTEHQQFSLENQSAAIHDYATRQDFVVTSTYSDAARSGLRLKNREGLKRLLQDVVADPPFKVVLVYDVSRWGRFQDADESAHYEFICRSAGVPVHYCAESFSNDGSVASSLMKALKRTMAAEFSRELGIKVYEGEKRLSELGFKMGGSPGLGYRRMLMEGNGHNRRLLAPGQTKVVKSDRVKLVQGPKSEVALVRKIFDMAAKRNLGARLIAKQLTQRQVLHPQGRKWLYTTIERLLKNPKYIGTNVWGRKTQRLYQSVRTLPKEKWITKPHAFDSIISEVLFNKIQERMKKRNERRSDERILTDLRRVLAKHGRLSQEIINRSGLSLCERAYRRRFGSLAKTYELIGWTKTRDYKVSWKKVKYRARLHSSIVAKALAANPGSKCIHRYRARRTMLQLKNGTVLSFAICPKVARKGGGDRWNRRMAKGERNFPALCCLLNDDGTHIQRMEIREPLQDSYERIGAKWSKPGRVIRSLKSLTCLVESLPARNHHEIL